MTKEALPIDLSEKERKTSSINEVTAEVNKKEVIGFGAEIKGLAGNGYSYTHDWGNMNGWWTLNLSWGVVNCNSRVFVSATEFGGGAQCGFIGGAVYTVHNVAPWQGGVSVKLHINWDNPIRVKVSYLVVNP